MLVCHVRIQRGGGAGGLDLPLKNHKNIGFLSNTGLDHLKNHKTTKPSLNNMSSLARHWHAFRWRTYDGPKLAEQKKIPQRWTPSENLSGSVILVFPEHINLLFEEYFIIHTRKHPKNTTTIPLPQYYR